MAALAAAQQALQQAQADLQQTAVDRAARWAPRLVWPPAVRARPAVSGQIRP